MCHCVRTCVRIVIILILFNVCENAMATEDSSALGAEYLQNAIRDIQRKNSEQIYSVLDNTRKSINMAVNPVNPTSTYKEFTTDITDRRTDNIIQIPDATSNIHVPSISLTKGELLALYEAALSKGNTIKLNHLDGEGTQLHAAVHELQPEHYESISGDSNQDASTSGYYYYYYPLKTFFNDFTQGVQNEVHKGGYNKLGPGMQSTLHSHTHQHNVNIEPIKAMMDMSNKNKALEPLFMAISGFVGMAIMFLFSMVFLPKLTGIKSRGVNIPKNPSERIVSLGSVVLDVIEGYDCSERITCEVNRTIRILNLHDNRFTKLLQRVMPKSFTRKIERIKRGAQKKKKCDLIKCKRKTETDKDNTNKVNLPK